MRQLLCYILFSIVGTTLLWGQTSATRDSLLRIATTTTNPSIQIATYRNLADLYFERPEELSYLKEAYRIARKVIDKDKEFSLLTDLSSAYIKSYELDSARHYMQVLEQTGNAEETLPYLSFLRMRIFDKKIRKNDGETAIETELKFLNDPATDKNNIYIQIEQAYTTGDGLFHKNKYKEARSYLNTAYKLSKLLPAREGERIRITAAWSYINTLSYLGEAKEFIECIEEMLRLYESSYELYYAHQRPFYNIDLRYLQCYTSLLIRSDQLTDEKRELYYQHVYDMSRKVTEPIDKYNCYLALHFYAMNKKDYLSALATNDSLIKYAGIVSPSNIPGLIENCSQIYETIGDYKNALKYHKLYVQQQDSIASSEFEQQMNELQVKYDVDNLNYKNSQLENKNKRILLITLGSILLLVMVICLYLYYDLKKEKRMKETLRELHEKAEESEQLKTAFINSMCHEIRTPLNAIVGFSDIITDESFDDEDTKKEYSKLITLNSQLLTSLIEHLFVVSNLDSSDEPLPHEMINVKNTCAVEMKKLEQQTKAGIDYRMELPEDDLFISSNQQYLSLVLENLLSNANKFTDQGSISLKLRANEAENRVEIDVTDTGPGIPLGKEEVVFQRFTKLDTFAQGQGMGLYLSRRIIQRLSGDIFIDPDYTNGTRMVIYLPLS